MSGNSRFPVSVHILAYLAFREGVSVPSPEIAASVSTHPVVIRRLLSNLVEAQLVSTQKGAGGGFTLAAQPEAISLLTIYRAVEPKPDFGMGRMDPNHDCPVGAKIGTILRAAFSKAQSAMEAELDRISLAEIHRELHSVCPDQR
jgi:Rrf2 family protein